jgi:hypothetical protein
MSRHLHKTFGLAVIGLSLVAGLAGAQGNSQGKGHGHGNGKGKDRDERVDDRRDNDRRDVNGVIVQDPNVVYGNGRKIPPGLAKKPGQMPPGQYKKRYGTNEGASVLGDILRRRGYTVTRIVPQSQSQYVYYRLRDGSERRAIVMPGSDRLGFQNVPSTVLQQVLAALYQ